MGTVSELRLRKKLPTPPAFLQESQKFSTDQPTSLPVNHSPRTTHEALPLQPLARLSPWPSRKLSTALPSSPQRKSLPQTAPPFTLECHGQDSRHCQPKGRSRQNHHCHQPRRLPRSRRPQGPSGRLRPPGQRLLRPRFAARRQPPLHLRRADGRLPGRAGDPAHRNRASLAPARLKEPHRRQYRARPPKTAPSASATPSNPFRSATIWSFSTARRRSICSPSMSLPPPTPSSFPCRPSTSPSKASPS